MVVRNKDHATMKRRVVHLCAQWKKGLGCAEERVSSSESSLSVAFTTLEQIKDAQRDHSSIPVVIETGRRPQRSDTTRAATALDWSDTRHSATKLSHLWNKLHQRSFFVRCVRLPLPPMLIADIAFS
jgi:hypothetical protein